MMRFALIIFINPRLFKMLKAELLKKFKKLEPGLVFRLKIIQSGLVLNSATFIMLGPAVKIARKSALTISSLLINGEN